MKRASAIIAGILLSISAWAQGGSITDVVAFVLDGRVITCNYSYSAKGDFPMNGAGSAKVCGKKYCIRENGLEYYSDGVSAWTVDRSAKEVLISDGSSSLLSHLDDYTERVAVFNFDGKTLTCTIKDEDKGLDIDFKATAIKAQEGEGDESAFVFDTSSLDKSWIITDLR